MSAELELMPVVGVRLVEGRSGSTLLMQLLATSPQIVFDDRYPAEYRFLSYFARIAEMITVPFDEGIHLGVTPFFFGETPAWGPIPFASDVVASRDLTASMLRGLWSGWTRAARARHPDAVAYAEKLAVEVEPIVEAGIPLRVIDLVRDPRDMLASIRAFVARGIDGFGRTAQTSEAEYLSIFLARTLAGFERISRRPVGFTRLVVRYEDLVTALEAETRRLADWLGVDLDAGAIARNRPRYDHHVTSTSLEASVGRWEDDLTDADVERIRQTLGEATAPFGYDL